MSQLLRCSVFHNLDFLRVLCVLSEHSERARNQNEGAGKIMALIYELN